MGKYQNKIVVGVVGHLDPLYLADFRAYLERYGKFRIVIFKDSHDKLWLTGSEVR